MDKSEGYLKHIQTKNIFPLEKLKTPEEDEPNPAVKNDPIRAFFEPFPK